MTRPFVVAVMVCSVLLALPARPLGAQPEKAPSSASKDTPAAHELAARTHFERGVALLDANRCDLALREFNQSIVLFPSAKATTNFVICLRRLGRLTEALAMVEVLLRNFPDLSEEARAAATHEAADLASRVGTLVLSGGPPGATVLVDERAVARLPLTTALRVNPGRYRIRVIKDWFEPFETSAVFRGGEATTVRAELTPLGEVGKLVITESTAREMELFLDGEPVGFTPWEGLVPAGNHVVVLAGPPPWGSMPRKVRVERHRITRLSLRAVSLDDVLSVTTEPPDADVLVDGVSLRKGRPALAHGLHRLRVEHPGYRPFEEKLRLRLDRRTERHVVLEPDPDAEQWARPLAAVLGLEAGLWALPSLNGDVEGHALGAAVQMRGAVSFERFVEFGVSAGFVGLEHAKGDRVATLQPVGLPGRGGTLNDELRLRAAVVGIDGDVAFGPGPRVHLRLGAGVVSGTLVHRRHGAFEVAGDIQPTSEEHRVWLIYVEPGVRLGVRVASSVELLGGIDVGVLIAPDPPGWSADKLVDAGPDGVATFPAETLLGKAAVVISPRLGVTYTF
jgi:hypothetical protein